MTEEDIAKLKKHIKFLRTQTDPASGHMTMYRVSTEDVDILLNDLTEIIEKEEKIKKLFSEFFTRDTYAVKIDINQFLPKSDDEKYREGGDRIFGKDPEI